MLSSCLYICVLVRLNQIAHYKLHYHKSNLVFHNYRYFCNRVMDVIHGVDRRTCPYFFAATPIDMLRLLNIC